jgi:hypothetical protein
MKKECGCSWIAKLVEFFAANPDALKSFPEPTRAQTDPPSKEQPK